MKEQKPAEQPKPHVPPTPVETKPQDPSAPHPPHQTPPETQAAPPRLIVLQIEPTRVSIIRNDSASNFELRAIMAEILSATQKS